MKTISISVLFCFLVNNSFSQTKDELKTDKADIEKEIEFTQKLLDQNSANKKKSISYVEVLERQINNKKKLLNSLNIESAYLINQINNIKKDITNLEIRINLEQNNLLLLKQDYAKMVKAAFKKKQKLNNWVFIMSSNSFNQAYKRGLYLKQYSDYRKSQSNKILNESEQLKKRQKDLETLNKKLKIELDFKKQISYKRKKETDEIAKNKSEQNKILSQLIKSEKQFQKKLELQQQKALDLELKIRKIIEQEIKRSRKKSTNNELKLTPEATKLSNNFESNKGMLPWPVAKGLIIKLYGKQSHTVFKSVQTFNNGIDIATEKDTDVRSVFDGTVSRIFFIKGEGKAILISHGDYYTVYSGLKNIIVEQGEEVLLNEKLGTVITKENENLSELHFEIWKGYNKKNPSDWLLDAY